MKVFCLCFLSLRWKVERTSKHVKDMGNEMLMLSDHRLDDSYIFAHTRIKNKRSIVSLQYIEPFNLFYIIKHYFMGYLYMQIKLDGLVYN